MTITISRLTASDIPGAVTAIQEAFAEDPYSLWIYNDRSKVCIILTRDEQTALQILKLQDVDNLTSWALKTDLFSQTNIIGRQKVDLARNRVSLGIRCHWGMRNALFFVAKDASADDKDKVLGVAMWMPPRPLALKETWGEWYESWKLWAQQVRMNLWYGRGGLNVKRYYIWKDKQAQAQSEIWTDPRGYYFLNIMVVLPGEHGKGIGRALAREVTKMADAEGKRCYLESSRDIPNIKIYETMGFHFVKGMDCDDDGDICKLYCMVREPQPSQ